MNHVALNLSCFARTWMWM